MILQGVLEDWPANSRWQRDAILERFGDSTTMRVRRGSTIAADNVNYGRNSSTKVALEIRRKTKHVPLREFIEEHLPVEGSVNLTDLDP